MISLHQFNLPFIFWWRKSYMDLITQDLVPWVLVLCFFFCKNVDHKQLTKPLLDLLDYQKSSWSHQMTLHGVYQVPPSWPGHSYVLCWSACPNTGQMTAWHVGSGCLNQLVIHWVVNCSPCELRMWFSCLFCRHKRCWEREDTAHTSPPAMGRAQEPKLLVSAMIQQQDTAASSVK